MRALLGQTNIKDVDMEAVRAGRSRAAEQFALAGQPSHNDLAGILLLTSTRLSSILAYAISLLHTRIRYPSGVPWCQCARCGVRQGVHVRGEASDRAGTLLLSRRHSLSDEAAPVACNMD